jgi:hypothetical protein
MVVPPAVAAAFADALELAGMELAAPGHLPEAAT